MVLLGTCALASANYLFIILRWLLEAIWWVIPLCILGGFLARTKMLKVAVHVIATLLAIAGSMAGLGVLTIGIINFIVGVLAFLGITWKINSLGILLAPLLMINSFFFVMQVKNMNKIL